jgi:uncharacterized OB-fold protein
MTHQKTVDDRFSRFGIKGFTAVSKVNDFIDHLEDGQVSGTRCKTCGQAFFPPRADCCQCLSKDMEWFDIEGAGSLISYSSLNYAPAGFEADVPYTVGLVDFKTCSVFGRIAGDVPEKELTVGMRMKLAVIRLQDDRIAYEFQKA